MKNLIIPIWILIFFMQDFYAQSAKWSWINPYPTGNLVNQSYFFDEQNGFTIGNNGTLLRTSDGGINWELKVSSSNLSLLKIFFVDEMHGWIIGNGIDQNYNPIPTIIITNDGGGTWDEYMVTQLNITLVDFFFIDAQIGWIVGLGGSIFKTTDGGMSWTLNSIPQHYNAWFKKIFFYNDSDGVILGYDSSQNPYVFIVGKTSDGGGTWDFKYSPFILDAEFSADFVRDSTFITLGSNGLIIRSTDNAETWSFTMGVPIEFLTCVDFNDSDFGLAGSTSGYLMKSFDGGVNWERYSSGFYAWIKSVQIVSNNFIAIAGNNNQYNFEYPYILTSTDTGLTWTNHTRFMVNPINISSISSINSQDIFICGTVNYNSGIIYRSENAGISWQQCYYLASGGLSDVKQLDENLIFACGGNYSEGLIIKSSNGGLSWQNSFISSYGISGLSTPDSSTMYAFAANKILKSTDLGANWSIIYQPSYAGFNDIEFISADTGYLVGGSYPSKIYKTADGGQNWNSYSIFSTSDVYTISFPSEEVGYAAGSSGVYKTSNAGISWVQLYIPNVYSIHDIVFNDELVGWVIGSRGIYNTTDGGQTWQLEFGKEDYTLHSFDIKRGESLWAVGDKSQIIKYSNDLVSSMASDQSKILPTEFTLFQNFPNPFNPTTKIRFDIPSQSQVMLKIYDILGTEIATIVNETLPAGSYSSHWDANGYASGVYLYKLKAGEFVETKKMILLK